MCFSLVNRSRAHVTPRAEPHVRNLGPPGHRLPARRLLPPQPAAQHRESRPMELGTLPVYGSHDRGRKFLFHTDRSGNLPEILAGHFGKNGGAFRMETLPGKDFADCSGILDRFVHYLFDRSRTPGLICRGVVEICFGYYVFVLDAPGHVLSGRPERTALVYFVRHDGSPADVCHNVDLVESWEALDTRMPAGNSGSSGFVTPGFYQHATVRGYFRYHVGLVSQT